MPDQGPGSGVSVGTPPQPTLDFRVTCQEEPNATVIKVTGDVDLSTIPRFDGALQRALARPAADLVVDLEKLTFIDASGLGALVRAHKAMAAADGGRAVVVHNPPPQASRLFELTGLDRVFAIR